MQFKGEVIRAETTKHYPPDTAAMALWLKNRRPNDWRETIRVDTHHHTAVVMLEPELVAKMKKAAGIEVIEGECEQIEK